MSIEVRKLEIQVEKLQIRVNQLMKERNMLLRTIENIVREHHVANEVSKMLDIWLDTPYTGSEEEDIREFAFKLTRFIKEKLA